MLPRLVREVLRGLLPVAQERRLRRLLGRKDEVRYGARATRRDEAQVLLQELEDFAAWAEDVLPAR